jgi:polysaccharide biosynthesis protein PslG
VQQVFSGPPAAWQPQLSAMSGGGLQLARIDARWNNVEPNPPSGGRHNYNWSMYDGIVQAMAQNGLRWYPIVAYSTAWSSIVPGDPTAAVAPDHLGDFAYFAFALAKRYGRGGTFWSAHPSLPQLPVTDYEIWNEENSTTFWHPQDSAPEAYADLYMAARAAIRSADPHATAVVGGLALGTPGVTDEDQFIQRMYAHRPDMRGNVDGVGLHPYQHSLADTRIRLARFRHALDQVAGPSVPIEITELGWATTSVPEGERVKDLSRLARQLPHSDCNIDRMLPYTWLTRESDPGDPEDWFGIWNHDGSGKPSGTAYLGAVKRMRGLTSRPAPTKTYAICHPGRRANAAGRGPKLRLRVLRVRRRHWVRVAVRCRPACLIRVALYGHSRSGRKRVSVRKLGVRTHRRVLKLRIRRARSLKRRAKLHATAAAASGVTHRSRSIRIR